MHKQYKYIKILAYDLKWPQLFNQVELELRQALGDHCITVHHIGSTSVPDLPAKEDIDILCIVDDLSSSLSLQNFGYTYKGEFNIPLRYFFSKNTPEIKINLHVVEPNHGFIELNLCFRDYLRNHEAARNAYANLKYKLVQDPTSFEKVDGRFPRYTLEKNFFIKRVLEEAGYDGMIINFCLHQSEWDTYHRICREQLFDPIGTVYDENHPSISADNRFHFVLYKGTSIVSVAQVELLNDAEAVLRKLATDTPYKGNGYAFHFVKFIEKWAKNKGVHVMKMHSHLEAEGFYRKLGYVDIIFDEPCVNPARKGIDLGKTL